MGHPVSDFVFHTPADQVHVRRPGDVRPQPLDDVRRAAVARPQGPHLRGALRLRGGEGGRPQGDRRARQEGPPREVRDPRCYHARPGD